MNLSRRSLLLAGSASVAGSLVGVPLVAGAQQAEFTYKFANNVPATHPLNVRATEAAAAIKAESKGRFQIDIFPNNQWATTPTP